jgi:hypothetical protein
MLGKRESELHGDMQRSAEMTGPPTHYVGQSQPRRWLVTELSEIPCRVSNQLASCSAKSSANRLISGKPSPASAPSAGPAGNPEGSRGATAPLTP